MLELIERFDLVGAFRMTLWLAFWSALWSLLIGTVVAIMRLSPVRALRMLGSAYVTLIRNTPLTLIIVACSFILWTQLGVNMASRESPTYIDDNNVRLAILGLSVYHAAFVCEALRSGVNTIPLGQAEAARSIGLTFAQNMRHVILPQAFRGAITPLGNVLIALTKNTTVATAIGVSQAAFAMRRMIEFRPDVLFSVFALIAIGFVIITLPMGMAISALSSRLAVKR
ncbi:MULTISPECIES: amino acid ABC transporter permease [unclassified Serinicoccus]|uniref:amino acid ABC transporter permease n=1 Tax=unclassified Serinicoccus TaxID=2643101 RepID=UPI0038528679